METAKRWMILTVIASWLLGASSLALGAPETESPEEVLKTGFGMVIGWPHYGLSLRKFFSSDFGLEAIAFPTYSYSDSTGTTSNSSHIAGRILFRLNKERSGTRPYLALGGGSYNSSSTSKLAKTISMTAWSALFGIEFSSFYTLEFGYGQVYNNTDNSVSGTVTIENGFHYFF